jgi:hypothetical protein
MTNIEHPLYTDQLDATRQAIAASLEREPGAMRPHDPLVRSLEALDAVELAMIMVMLSSKTVGRNNERTP